MVRGAHPTCYVPPAYWVIAGICEAERSCLAVTVTAVGINYVPTLRQLLPPVPAAFPRQSSLFQIHGYYRCAERTLRAPSLFGYSGNFKAERSCMAVGTNYVPTLRLLGCQPANGMRFG